MKKTKNTMTLIASIIVVFLFQSCENSSLFLSGSGPVIEEEIELTEFNGIKSEIAANIYLTQNPVQKVDITAQENIIDNMIFSIDNGILTIEFDKNVRNHKSINIYINMKDLTYANLLGSGEIKTISQFNSESFKAVLSGSGKINALIETENAVTNLIGSGSISINGKYKYLEGTILGSGNINYYGTTSLSDFVIDGSGNINAFGLISSETKTSTTGSGNIKITTNDLLDVSISGSGNVYYKGYPNITSKITGSGKVKNAN